jgi:hypothetical protein
MLRVIAVVAGLASALPAIGGEMKATDARHFVTGKLFSYACFDGTRGLARVNPDGSGDGSIQPKGAGPMRYGTMPAATLRVEGERICASLASSIIQPCFYLERTNAESFRGSISGLSFAYCDFTRYEGRAHFVQSARQRRLLSQTADK